MRTRTGLVAGMLVVGLLSTAGQVLAQEPISISTSGTDPLAPDNETEPLDPYRTLPPGTVETINTMSEGACEQGLQVLNEQGWTAPDVDEYGYEYDLLTGVCKEFRDTLEHRVLNGEDPPWVQKCNYTYGVTCVAVGHYACDFAIMVATGLVYHCVGGIIPYN